MFVRRLMMQKINLDNNSNEFLLNQERKQRLVFPYNNVVKHEESGELNAFQKETISEAQKTRRNAAKRKLGDDI
jgi:hypothetical protein